MTKEEVLQNYEDALIKVVIKLTNELNNISKVEKRVVEIGGKDIEIENTLLSDNKDEKTFERVLALFNNSDKVKNALGIPKPGKEEKSGDIKVNL